MKHLKKIVVGLLVVIALAATGVYLFLLSTKPTLSGELILNGLADEVEVYYDAYGVPHIFAQNEADTYFALGYVHAQDRLFQMEMLRRAAAGRLAEILGPDLIPVDKLFRTLGLNQFAKEHAVKFLAADTADFQRAVHAYQKGINQFIEKGKTPIEFTIIGIPKTEFTPEDIYLAVGFMSFGFAEGFRIDPVLEKIKEEFGPVYLHDLAVDTPADAVRIKSANGPVKQNDQLIAALNHALNLLPVPQLQGSNGWVVSPAKSVTGFPILSNDTHIEYAQPAVWYEAHLEYPGFSFYGHHLAGIPFGLLGNNRFCGVGLTMFENDDVDFFRETINPLNPNQVKFGENWDNLSLRNEVIKVKGQEDVRLPIRTSRHGPIVNGVVQHVDEITDPVALSWQLLMVENQAVQAAYQLNHATTFKQAQEAVSLFSSPGLNVMYGDTEGNIAWWAVAKLPIRPHHVQSKFFLDGATGQDEYLGYYDFSKNPHAVNPPWGFVYSANNQPDTVDGILYPGYYYPKSRAGRIFELLAKNKKFSVADFKEMILDVKSHMNADIAKEISNVLDRSKINDDYKVVIEELKNWTGEDKADLIAPSMYYNMLSQIIFLAMEDELGTEALKSLLVTSLPKNSYEVLIRNSNSPWWDNVHTEKAETREDLIVQAARNTISLLSSNCGKNPEQWIWGKIHTLTHSHPLSAAKPLDKFFNVGPFAVDGGSEVINNLHFKLDTVGYFPVSGGPALRKITDLGDIENGITVSPTGQSGNVMSPHYSDQAQLFATGKFRKMMMNRNEIEQHSKNKLTLKPRQ